METIYENEANIFKALCDPNRLVILETLQVGEKCACKLLCDLKIVQSTLSHHMKILCDAGFVDVRRDGKWMYYSLNTQGFRDAQKYLDRFQDNIQNNIQDNIQDNIQKKI